MCAQNFPDKDVVFYLLDRCACPHPTYMIHAYAPRSNARANPVGSLQPPSGLDATARSRALADKDL
jgi:hypothetical protein